jgi:ankyrin repeat protein
MATMRKCPTALLKSQTSHGRFRVLADELAKQLAPITEEPALQALAQGAADSTLHNALAQGAADSTLQNANPVISAVYRGDFAEVERLVNSGHGNATDSLGLTPLMAAAATGKSKTIKFLLSKKVAVNARDTLGRTALMHATLTGKVDIMAMLIQHRANVNTPGVDTKTPLHVAARLGSSKGVSKLIAAGARVNFTSANGMTSLHDSCQQGMTHTTMELLRSGASPDPKTEQGYTPLHFATAVGSTEIIAMLIVSGADIFARASNGDTPIKMAVNQSTLTCHTFLELTPNLDLSTVDENGDSLLHLSSQEGNANFEYLARHGADVNAINSTGDSVLHTIALSGDCNQALLLLSMGANPLLKNHFGDQAVDICKVTRPDIASEIFKYMQYCM